jgi:eukaryotic-like serine/threonine-protein kinase
MPPVPPAVNHRTEPAAAAQAVRFFGRFQLMRLLGKSARSMVWLVLDTGIDREAMLVIPRVQPADASAAQRWHQAVQRAARLDHPRLATVLEVGEHERWPYQAFERGTWVTLAELLSPKGFGALDVSRWTLSLLEGLAFAHEAGVAHHDLQPHMVLVSEQGAVRLMGLEVAHLAAADGAVESAAQARQAQRDAAQRDLLSIGLLMQHLLAGAPALGEPDIGKVIDRLPPTGRDFVRLGFDLPQPVPDPLRAIVNRATDRQQRHRYRAARTLSHALEGWLQSQGAQGGGPLALLLERIRSVGLLPASPGAGERAARLALLERSRTSELAEVVLEDPALSFELLRNVNSAQVGGATVSSTGPVLTVRRAIAMLGMDGVRRAALSLRAWPGPMSEAAAARLETEFQRARRAARLARQLVPAGYDGEVIHLVTMLQTLGPLVLRYHLPEDAGQIEKLMQPEPGPDGGPDEPGMDPQAASYAVLGVSSDELAIAIARHVGFGDDIVALSRRLPPGRPVHPEGDDMELLRAAASCAHEALEAAAATSPRAALQKVIQRYGRALGLSMPDLVTALQGGALASRAAPAAAGSDTAGATGVPLPRPPVAAPAHRAHP